MNEVQEKSSKKTISVRFSEEEVDAIASYAEQEDLTVSQVIRKAVKQFLGSAQ